MTERTSYGFEGAGGRPVGSLKISFMKKGSPPNETNENAMEQSVKTT
jgi:hypothetical protein